MPPRKQPQAASTPYNRQEEYKTLDQVLHPTFYDTKQQMFTILMQMPTATKHKHQYAEGSNNTERRMIDNAKQSLALIQEITKHPVELHYNTIRSGQQHEFVIALSAKASLVQLKDVVKLYIHNVLQSRQFSDQIKLLIATGQKIDWQQERSHVHQHIIKPAVMAMLNKNKNSKLPEQYSTHSKQEAGLQEQTYSSSLRLSGIGRLILQAYQSMAGSGEALFHLQTQPNKHNSEQAKLTQDTFYKQFMTGTQKSKEKKIGGAMQFFISSAGFTIEQLQSIKQTLEQQYTVKVPRIRKPSPD